MIVGWNKGSARIGGGLKFWVLFLLAITVALVDKFDFDSGSKIDLDKNKWLFF